MGPPLFPCQARGPLIRYHRAPEGGENITGLVGLASGLTMSSVAPARSVCCKVLSPMCSFSPSNTRLSVVLALVKLKVSELPYLVCEPWYLAKTENGAVGSRHSALACHDQVWKPVDG